MKLVPNAGAVLKGAWSIRLILLAALLSGFEAGLPIIDQIIIIPRGTFAVASILVSSAAFVARFIAQEGITYGQL